RASFGLSSQLPLGADPLEQHLRCVPFAAGVDGERHLIVGDFPALQNAEPADLPRLAAALLANLFCGLVLPGFLHVGAFLRRETREERPRIALAHGPECGLERRFGRGVASKLPLLLWEGIGRGHRRGRSRNHVGLCGSQALVLRCGLPDLIAQLLCLVGSDLELGGLITQSEEFLLLGFAKGSGTRSRFGGFLDTQVRKSLLSLEQLGPQSVVLPSLLFQLAELYADRDDKPADNASDAKTTEEVGRESIIHAGFDQPRSRMSRRLTLRSPTAEGSSACRAILPPWRREAHHRLRGSGNPPRGCFASRGNR